MTLINKLFSKKLTNLILVKNSQKHTKRKYLTKEEMLIQRVNIAEFFLNMKIVILRNFLSYLCIKTAFNNFSAMLG